MKSAVVLSFALLVGSIALAAQTAIQDQKSYGVARMESLGAPNTPSTVEPPINLGCPVLLDAQHRADGDLLKVDRSRPARPAQLLHLTLTSRDSRQILAARVRVHGLSGKGRVTQAQSGQDSADATRTMNVTFSAGPDKASSGDLWVPGMTAVLSIDLNSVTYSDGSTWSFTGREGCHVAPDPLMLVAGH